MSRIGKLPIAIPAGVKVIYNLPEIKVEGPKGKLSRIIMEGVSIELTDAAITVNRDNDSIKSRSAHGLTRTLVNNMVIGVSKGFERLLEINGVGYRAEVAGDTLTMALGYSHPVVFKLPKGVAAKVDKNKVILSSSDRDILGQTAAKVRELRPPEPYKGKGVKYADETILRKAGKTGKK